VNRRETALRSSDDGVGRPAPSARRETRAERWERRGRETRAERASALKLFVDPVEMSERAQNQRIASHRRRGVES
jgi:hypothetical protein